MAIAGITCGVLAVVFVFAYMYWGWAAVFSRAYYFPEEVGLGPEARAEARAAALRYGRWARASRVAAFALGGVALGCAAIAGWRERRAWREWPWPSLVCFFPVLFALVVALIGKTAPALEKIAFAVAAVSFFAALFDLWRGEAGSAGRPLKWTVLVVGILALLLRPLRGW